MLPLADVKVGVQIAFVKVAVDFEINRREVEIIILDFKSGELQAARQREGAAADITRKVFYVELLALEQHGNIYLFNQGLHAFEFYGAVVQRDLPVEIRRRRTQSSCS